MEHNIKLTDHQVQFIINCLEAAGNDDENVGEILIGMLEASKSVTVVYDGN